MKSYDVTIVGAGMAGATLAIALHQYTQGKLKIALVEAHPSNLSTSSPSATSQSHPGFDARTLALSYGTSKALKSLNLWQDFAPFVTPITDIEVSDKGHLGLVDLSAKKINVPALGYVVELNDVATLYQKHIQAIDCDYYCPRTVSAVEREQDRVIVTLKSLVPADEGAEIRFQTQLLVATDGANSHLGQLIGMQTKTTDYNQHAIIANVATTQDHNGKAFERFTANGPLAFLPMSVQSTAGKLPEMVESAGRNAVVWCVPSDQVQDYMALDDKAVCDKLQQEFGWRLGKITHIGKRHSYPLIEHQAQSIISHRFVALGNAAQALHPIAGQGFNLGIRDVVQLASCLFEAYQDKQDLGAYSLLSDYQRKRQKDRQSTLSLTGGLVRIFSNDWLSLRIGRNLGLLAMDLCPNFKQPLIRHTMNGNQALAIEPASHSLTPISPTGISPTHEPKEC